MNRGVTVSAISGVTALVGLIIHIVRYAYSQGQMNQRLKTLEGALEGHGEIRELLASLTSTVRALEGTVSELKAAVHEIAPRSVKRTS